MYMCDFFFFSSRRRHTRYWRDWSSDVCSSDLGENNYREYSFTQIPTAHMILLLKKLSFQNSEIKNCLEQYATKETLNLLRQKKINIEQEILEEQKRKVELEKHIHFIESLLKIKEQLDIPFLKEEREERKYYYLKAEEETTIHDLFKKARQILGEEFWLLKYQRGILISKQKIRNHSYPIQALYMLETSFSDLSLSMRSMPKGKYLCLYTKGGLENNPHLFSLLEYAKKEEYCLGDDIYIEEISGPGIENKKEDFLILIQIPIMN